MQESIKRGAYQGALFGLIFAWAGSFTAFPVSRFTMELNWSPLNLAVVRLGVASFLLCVVYGALLGPLEAKLRHRHPYPLVHLLPMSLVLTALLSTPILDGMFWLSTLSVGVAHGTAVVGWRLYRWKPRSLLAIPPVLVVLWVAAIVPFLRPTLEHSADPARPKAPAGAPNVLWIVMDTTRADRLTPYGHSRDTTPTLAKLASEGTLFEKAYSTAPWTVASHAGMFTGKYSIQHGCTHSHLYLDGKHPTIAGELTKHGYESAIFGGNMWLDDYTGLARGFQTLFSPWQTYSFNLLFVTGRLRAALFEDWEDKGGKTSNALFKDWLEDRDAERPFFAFINYLEPHAPYHQVPYDERIQYLGKDTTPREARRISFKYARRMVEVDDYVATDAERQVAYDLYDGAIHYTDRLLEDVIEHLKRKNLLDNTLVIVNGDHGEMFGEHDVYGHDVAIYHPLLHVPLVMRLPGKIPAGHRTALPVQLIDIFPTLFELAGLKEKQPEVSGVSLLKTLGGDAAPDRTIMAEYYRSHMRPLVAEMKRQGFDPETFHLRTSIVEDWQYIRGPEEYKRLFDLRADPELKQSLEATRPDDVQRLDERLKALDALPRTN